MRITEQALIIVFLLCGASAKQKWETAIRVDSFGNCINSTHLPVYFNDSGVEPVGKTSMGYGTLINTLDINSIEKLVVKIIRCQESADLTCELFQTWRFGTGVCDMIQMKNALWSPLTDFHPSLRCPLKKGVYNIHGATVDVKALAGIKFPTDGYWKCTVDAFVQNTRYFCHAFSGKFIRIKI